jgi:hypothetical protein
MFNALENMLGVLTARSSEYANCLPLKMYVRNQHERIAVHVPRF